MGYKQQETKARSVKGAVSISSYHGRLRILWRMEDKRSQLYLPLSIDNCEKLALQIKQVIEKGLINGIYDETLHRYRSIIQQAALDVLAKEQLPTIVFRSENARPANPVLNQSIDILKEFDRYLVIKDKVNGTNYYALTRKAMIH